jgi:uncharacterized protein involved in exopolysaccharide biosynthesis
MDALQMISFSLRDVAYVVFKRRSQILLFFLAIVATVAIWTFLATPIYEAESEILVKTGRENIYMPASTPGTSQSAVISLNREEQISSEIQILTTQALLEKTIESLGPAIIYKEFENQSSWLGEFRGPSRSGGGCRPTGGKRLQKDLWLSGQKSTLLKSS